MCSAFFVSLLFNESTACNILIAHCLMHCMLYYCLCRYCVLGEGEVQSVNAWLGPAGTVTPLHHDPHHNLLAQVGTGIGR